MSKEKITNCFAHIKVYGNNLTVHHKDQIFDAVYKINISFTNWLHHKGFKQVKHIDYHPRVWKKKKDKNRYSESDLFFDFLKDAQEIV